MTFQIEWLLAAAVLLAAYLVRGIAGFGSALIAVPLLAMMFPVQIVVPVVVLFDYIGSMSQGIRNRDRIAWREELALIPFTLIGVALGLSLLQSLGSATQRQALGTFIIVYAIYQVLPLPVLRGSRLFAAPCGFFAGQVPWAILAGLPVVAAGLWLGGRVHSTISTATYARIISALLLFSGIVLLAKS